ncbi:RNA-processing protein, partial [mine drainage metagenome]
MPTLFARIPEDRVGVLIGPGGRTRRELAAATRTVVDVESAEGEVRIQGPDDDPIPALQARDIVLAIGRGFSPTRAFRLL